MYWRQKVVIELLGRTPNKSASKLQLVKWLFLLQKEEQFYLNGSFYDFFPHKFGPFSFLLYKDLSDMEKAGEIKLIMKNIQYKNSQKKIITDRLPKNEVQSITNILEKYGSLPENKLLNYVYSTYPWYASRSLLLKTPLKISSDQLPPAIYSLGYEGLSIDTFLNIVLWKGLKRVIDVRNNPFSRKYGFSSNQLKQKCQEIDIKYYHFPELGIPSSIRNENKNIKELWETYEDVILPNASRSIDIVKKLCTEKASVLLCFEQDPATCHRSILARYISESTSLPIYHYENVGNRWLKE